ncbi:MAG TPA: DUF4404 family protein [Steroidobacteraceae bacterium]|jgi:uncharacterized protein with von Willebrand factor type A (vWA) domain|nr:DUF4404 family protein [Steroidobacteraceae bacterium]
MSRQDLQKLLAQLHARLGGARSVSDEERAQLTTVLRDIEKVLGKQEETAARAKPRLEAFAVKFEADHPALAESLRQLVDLLAKAGI